MNNSHQEIHLKVLRHVEEHPDVTQRELAQHLGISLGKANYCLKALIDKGFIKARNFRNSNNKRAYLYKLTPSGIEAKARISMSFLRRKMDEYEQLKKEIDLLQDEVNGN
jgi:EPS-associated MarR family transcriptional regulator